MCGCCSVGRVVLQGSGLAGSQRLDVGEGRFPLTMGKTSRQASRAVPTDGIVGVLAQIAQVVGPIPLAPQFLDPTGDHKWGKPQRGSLGTGEFWDFPLSTPSHWDLVAHLPCWFLGCHAARSKLLLVRAFGGLFPMKKGQAKV